MEETMVAKYQVAFMVGMVLWGLLAVAYTVGYWAQRAEKCAAEAVGKLSGNGPGG